MMMSYPINRMATHWAITGFFIWSAASVIGVKSAQLNCETRRVDMCPQYDDLSLRLNNISLQMDPETGTLYVSGALHATEPFESGTKGTIKIKRCWRNDMQSCEKYLETDIEDFCSKLPEKDKLWSPIVSNLEDFEPHCPIPAGVYVVNEAPIDTNQIKNEEDFVGNWQLQIMLKSNERVITCIQADVVVSRN